MPLTWIAKYKDGSEHHYDEGTKRFFNIAHVDNTKLDLLVFKDPKAIVPVLVVHFDDPRKRLVLFHRNELPSGKKPYHTRCWAVGWQMMVKGKNVQSINYVIETIGRKIMHENPDPNGDPIEVIEDVCWVENAGEFNRARDPWFKPPSKQQLEVVGSRLKK